MILGMEIGLFVLGLVALTTGKMTLSKSNVVVGPAARVLGLVAMSPLPIAFLVGIAFALAANPANPQKFAEDNRWTLTAVEAVIVIGIALLVYAVGATVGVHPAEAARRQERRPWEDERDDNLEAAFHGEPRPTARKTEDAGVSGKWVGVVAACVVAGVAGGFVASAGKRLEQPKEEEAAQAPAPAPEAARPLAAAMPVPDAPGPTVLDDEAPAPTPKPPLPAAKTPTPKAAPLTPRPRPAEPPGPAFRREQLIGSPFGTEARDAAPPGGLLVGFEVGLTKFTTSDMIGTLRPIYHANGADSFGRRVGTDSKVGTVTVLAAEGYAVGAITATSGLGIDGFSVTFMKVAGDRLNPADAYESEWVGRPAGSKKPARQTGNGAVVVGVLTRLHREQASAVGLEFRPAR